MNRLSDFKLERYFAKYEFATKHLLSPSDCDAPTIPQLLSTADDECRSMWESMKLSYTESQGLPLLRQEVTKLYTSIASIDQVVVAAPEELIFLTMHAVLEAGDEVVVVSPAYQSLFEVASSLGCHVKEWRLREVPFLQAEGGCSAGRWELDVGELAALITARTKLVVVNFPHNPTGYIPPLTVVSAVVELARERQIFIFSDEMYRLLEHHHEDASGGEDIVAIPSFCDVYERAISLSGMSKSYGLPGLRIGWVATRTPQIVEKILKLKDYTTICNSGPSEILALIGLRNRDRLVARNLSIIRTNIDLVKELCARHPRSLAWVSPSGGSTAFVRWKSEITDLDHFCEKSVTEEGLMIVPGSKFSDHVKGYFRVGLGRELLREALPILEKLLVSLT